MTHASGLLRRVATGIMLLAGAVAAHAMSVIAPTFDELAANADLIVRGVVTDIHCVTVDTPQGQAIRTVVTLQVEHALKGSPGPQVSLTFLGGTVGRRTLKVLGMPQFKIGDREIVFVANNGQSICPLIAAGYGRFHVRHDASTDRDYVARDNEAPLTSTDEIKRPLDGTPPRAASGTGALSPEAFEASIAAAVGPKPGVQP